MEAIHSHPITERRHQADRRASTRAATSRSMSAVDWVAMTLLIVGGINWGLVGLLNLDLVAFLFGEMSLLSRVVYVVVGLCALYAVYLCSKIAGQRR